MRKRCITIGIGVMCTASVAMAQSPAAKGQVATGKTAKAVTVIATGCVARSADGKRYMLNDAIMAPASTDKAPSPAATPGTPGDKTILSYVLDGGDVKSHLGHKVEISGTKVAENTMAMDHKDVGGTLKVKSVKMIAATCM